MKKRTGLFPKRNKRPRHREEYADPRRDYDEYEDDYRDDYEDEDFEDLDDYDDYDDEEFEQEYGDELNDRIEDDRSRREDDRSYRRDDRPDRDDDYDDYDREQDDYDDYEDDYEDDYPEEDYEDYPEDEYGEGDYDDYRGDYRDDYEDDYRDDYDDYPEDYRDDYGDDRRRRAAASRRSRRGSDREPLGEKILEFIGNTTAVERAAAIVAVFLIAGAVATGTFYAKAMGKSAEMDSFAEVGSDLEGSMIVGQSGLLAMADAQRAKLIADDTEEAKEEEEQEEKVTSSKNVTVNMTATSIKSDLKIKFINSETKKLVANVHFEISVVTPDGTTVKYDDHDKDGIIYKNNLTAGNYKITPLELSSEFSDYKLDTSSKSVTVKDKVEMKAVDVSNEIKKESQINAAQEDTAVQNVVESKLDDTVEWVESTKTPIGDGDGKYNYEKIDKSKIVDPTTSSRIFISGYKTLAAASVDVGSGFMANDDDEPSFVVPTDDDEDEESDEGGKGKSSDKGNSGSSSDKGGGSSSDSGNTGNTGSGSETGSGTGGSGSGSSDSGNTGSTEKPDDSSNSDTEPSYVVGDKDKDKDKETKGKVPMKITMLTLTKDQTYKLTSSDSKVKVTLSVKDEDIATVSGNVITAKKPGTTTITVSAKGYEDAEVDLVVVKKDTVLKDKDGNTIYVKNKKGEYVEATADDYNKAKEFFVRKAATAYKYTGWQTIDGKTYFFDKNGNKVTGDQVIQGAKYHFDGDGVLSSSSGVMGIDVSKWNGSINWSQVKNSGVNYVIIRCGYRGSSQGALVEDPKYKENIKGALAAGLRVGIYFFTQAVNEVEAVEEASMAISLAKGYSLSFPIYLDVEASNGRGDNISASQRTANIKAFCGTVQNAGFKAGVYANKTWLSGCINTSQLTSYKIWLAQYTAAPTYSATRFDMWQYTSKGKVSGISGNVDMNICY
ncbi:MAG: hypothetical protein K6G10_09145 [Butyrivibrio sp.]|nr:hypothetical protein [Butyrivibrio sp.]